MPHASPPRWLCTDLLSLEVLLRDGDELKERVSLARKAVRKARGVVDKLDSRVHTQIMRQIWSDMVRTSKAAFRAQTTICTIRPFLHKASPECCLFGPYSKIRPWSASWRIAACTCSRVRCGENSHQPITI
jgi:hypothetical protein